MRRSHPGRGAVRERGQVHGLLGLVGPAGQRQLDELVDQVGQLAGLALDVGDEAAARVRRQLAEAPQHARVGAQAGQRGAQLVGGVLDQPFLRVAGGGEPAEHRVERRREAGRPRRARPPAPARSSRPSTLTSSATPASRTSRRVMRRASSQPAPAATSRTATLAEAISLAMPPSTCSVSSTSTPTCSAPPAVPERGGEDPVRLAADVDLGDGGAAGRGSGGERPGRRGHRQADGRGRRGG